jgi:hypothetical protein
MTRFGEQYRTLLQRISEAKSRDDHDAQEIAERELATLIRGIQPPLPVDFKKAQACDAETK